MAFAVEREEMAATTGAFPAATHATVFRVSIFCECASVAPSPSEPSITRPVHPLPRSQAACWARKGWSTVRLVSNGVVIAGITPDQIMHSPQLHFVGTRENKERLEERETTVDGSTSVSIQRAFGSRDHRCAPDMAPFHIASAVSRPSIRCER